MEVLAISLLMMMFRPCNNEIRQIRDKKTFNRIAITMTVMRCFSSIPLLTGSKDSHHHALKTMSDKTSKLSTTITYHVSCAQTEQDKTNRQFKVFRDA